MFTTPPTPNKNKASLYCVLWLRIKKIEKILCLETLKNQVFRVEGGRNGKSRLYHVGAVLLLEILAPAPEPIFGSDFHGLKSSNVTIFLASTICAK